MINRAQSLLFEHIPRDLITIRCSTCLYLLPVTAQEYNFFFLVEMIEAENEHNYVDTYMITIANFELYFIAIIYKSDTSYSKS